MLIVTAQQIRNVQEVADYRVTVRVNERTIWNGEVTGHDRDQGWIARSRKLSRSVKTLEVFHRFTLWTYAQQDGTVTNS